MTIRTIGEALDAGWRIKTKCLGLVYADKLLIGSCGEKWDLEMRTLVWTRGRNLLLTQLPQRFKCPYCGSRRIRLLYDIPSEPAAGAMSLQVWSTKDVE